MTSTELDLSLKDDDDVIVTIKLESVNVAQRELMRQLVRCESSLAARVSADSHPQALSDLVNRKHNLESAIDDMANIQAQVRLKERSQG